MGVFFSKTFGMEAFSLAGKIAFISGSTAGIGFQTAVTLSKAGASVIINGRSQERVDEAVSKLKEQVPGANVQGVVGNLGTAEGVKEVTEKITDIDILVNNMGIFEPRNFEDITDEEWMTMFEVNVMSGVRLCRFYFPKLKEKGWGRIVFISSESAVNIPTEMIHYGMSKTCQVAIARGLAESTSGTNVTVNSILVGPTYSDGVKRFVNQLAESKNISVSEVEDEFFKETRPTSIIKRFLQEEEVANMVLYLSSPASSGTNGAALRVDGGLLRNCM